MSVDRKDFTTAFDVAARQRSNAPDNITKLRVMERAALDAEHLTNDGRWDKYLTYLQAAKDRLIRVRDAAAAMLQDPRVVSADAMLAAKISFVAADAQIECLSAVMSIPKEIIAAGENARDMLTKLGASDGGDAA